MPAVRRTHGGAALLACAAAAALVARGGGRRPGAFAGLGRGRQAASGAAGRGAAGARRALSSVEEEVRIRRSLEGDQPASRRHGAAAAASGGPATPGAARASSFEDAQVLGRELATALAEARAAGEPLPPRAAELLRALVSTTAGARGWFVTLLTDPAFEPLFQPPLEESLLQALEASPDTNARLMVMNIAMPAATELAHAERGSHELAAASRRTRDRASTLAVEMLGRLPGLRGSLGSLLSAVVPGEPAPDKEWSKFCRKWGYNEEQKEAIRKQVELVLSSA